VQEPLGHATIAVQYPIYKLSQLRFHVQLGDGVSEMRFERMTMGPLPLVIYRRLRYKEGLLAFGRTQLCDLLIRSQTRSRTGGDREEHGETKPCFYGEVTHGGEG
jgi:hypothetical protein